MSDLRLVLLDRNGLALYVNPDDVSTAHEQTDHIYGTRTVITMKTGEKHTVSDPIRDVMEMLAPNQIRRSIPRPPVIPALPTDNTFTSP